MCFVFVWIWFLVPPGAASGRLAIFAPPRARRLPFVHSGSLQKRTVALAGPRFRAVCVTVVAIKCVVKLKDEDDKRRAQVRPLHPP